MSRAKVGVLFSGRGTTMQSLIDAAQAPDCPFEIALAVSNKADAAGLNRAKAAGIATVVIDHKPHGKDREAHERLVDAALRAAGCEYVALGGYMRIMTPWLVDAWAGRMINIHPALLPKYPGLDTHRRALEAGDTEAGCSVHLVIAGVDEGPILGQARVPILPGDDEATLAARVLVEEHRLFPKCLAELVSR